MKQLNGMTLPWPVDWPELFGRDAPLILEIGFGRGTFLIHLAETHPDASIIGLEISNRCLVAAERAADRLKLAHLRVIHAQAEMALAHLFTPGSLSEVHINFPDPWFKTGHVHRRLMKRETVDALVSRLAPGGRLYLATDILDYARMSAALLRATPGLDNLLDADWSASLPGRVKTKYEAFAEEQGRERCFFAYQRNDRPAPDVPVLKESDMPHMVFETPLTLGQIEAQFEPRKTLEGETLIHLMAVYRGQHSLLFEVYIKEPTLDQHVAIMLNENRDATYTLLVSTLGHPRATAGIHRAVARVADWIFSLHPQTRAIRVSLQTADE